MFQRPQLQDQLENIEQAANVYFNEAIAKQAKKASRLRPGMQPQGFGFDDPNQIDKQRYSEISQNLAHVVNQIFDVIEPSSRFGQPDQTTLRDSQNRAEAALRFQGYRRWDTYVIADEDILKAVVPEGQQEYPISVSEVREEFKEGLDAIGRILTRIPDQAHGEIEEAGSKQQARKTRVAVFPSAPDLRWEEVSMAFVSDEVIKVRARKQLREYKFDQIGFEDKRTDRPSRLWLFLRALAAANGQTSWQDLDSTGGQLLGNKQVKSHVSRLRKILKNFMEINQDPFSDYRRVGAYKTRFALTNEANVRYEEPVLSDVEEAFYEDTNPKGYHRQ